MFYEITTQYTSVREVTAPVASTGFPTSVAVAALRCSCEVLEQRRRRRSAAQQGHGFAAPADEVAYLAR